MKDYYYILGVGRGASLDEIKTAYRRLSLKFHPDKNNGEVYFSEMFRQVNEAYEVLRFEASRRRYDEVLLENENVEKRARAAVKDEWAKEDNKLSEKYRQQREQLDKEKSKLEREKAELASNRAVVSSDKASRKMYTNVVDKTDVWQSVKRWRSVRNVLILLNILLVCVFVYVSGERGNSKMADNGYVWIGKIVSRSGANMRHAPDATSQVVAKVPYYTDIRVIKEEPGISVVDGVGGRWCKVEYNGYIGWVWGNCLKRR